MLYMVTWIPSIYPSHVSIYIYIPYMSYMDPMGDIIWTCFFQKQVHWFTHTGWNRPLKIKLYSTHGRMYHQRGQRQRPKYLAFESFPWRKSWLFFLESPLNVLSKSIFFESGIYGVCCLAVLSKSENRMGQHDDWRCERTDGWQWWRR